MAKNQGPRSSRSRIKYTIQDPGFLKSRVKYKFQHPGFPRSHVKYTFQDPGFPGSHFQYTLQDPRFPRSHVRYTFQDPGFPRSHDKYKFQDPESSRSHNLESPRSPQVHISGSGIPKIPWQVGIHCRIQCSQGPTSSWLTTYNLPPSTYHLKLTTYNLKLPPTTYYRQGASGKLYYFFRNQVFGVRSSEFITCWTPWHNAQHEILYLMV